MLFNSPEFIFLFLPVALVAYFMLNKRRLTTVANIWLVVTSLFFYSWWNIKYLPLLLVSIIFNYVIGSMLNKITSVNKNNNFRQAIVSKKVLLIFGILMNIVLLGYFKYANFFISNINYFASSGIPILSIVLPLGISFFTFTQIAYLVDTYKGDVEEYSFLNYSLFVTFFPHLLAGPIIHHKEIMPQFDRIRCKALDYKNLSIGLFLFFMGLFKKVVIADTFSVLANYGFDTASTLTLLEAWVTSLSYTFQIYFDFSGYTDMALGSALMFNIKLPINFNSPYKSTNIQEFWRNWHITLSRFLRDYVYIPLGGNRLGDSTTYQNIMVIFLVGGLWHGAGWMFIFWGLLHGVATVIHRLWRKLNISMSPVLAWFLTFNFVNITWIFFRAKSYADALKILKGMFGFNGIRLPGTFRDKLTFLSSYGIEFGSFLGAIGGSKNTLLIVIAAFIITIFLKNSNEMLLEFKPNYKSALFAGIVAVYTILSMNRVSEFLYFNF